MSMYKARNCREAKMAYVKDHLKDTQHKRKNKNAVIGTHNDHNLG